eukprot:43255_1
MSGMKLKLECYPNGWFEEGLVDIDIIPVNVSDTLDISYCVKCKNANYENISDCIINGNTKRIELRSIFPRGIFSKSDATRIMFKICATTAKQCMTSQSI